MRLLGSWRTFLQVLVVPGEDTVQAIQKVFFFVKAVGLARVHNEFSFDTVAFEAAIEFVTLAGGIDSVRVTLKNQSRRVHILQMDEGRTVQESGDLFRLVRETVEPLVVGGALLSPVLGDEIGQPRARDGRL